MEDDLSIPFGDIRQRDSSSDRQEEFKRGWTAAAKDLNDSDKLSKYADGLPPEGVTWGDLGYRLGRLFDETDDDLRQELFEWCLKKQNREIQRREPPQERERTKISNKEKIETPGFSNRKCEYCPHRIESITLPEEKAKKINNSSVPPTHIEIKCPKCKNTFYWTQDRWDFSFDSERLAGGIEIEKRKTSPGKNVYVPKEHVINVE
jgi:phage FluMu protein Com